MPRTHGLLATVGVLVALVLTILPSQVNAQLGRDFTDGVQLFDDGDYQRAIEKLQAAVEAQPELESAWYYLGRAHLSVPSPNLQAALDAFQRAVEITPQRPGIRLYVGQVYEDQGAYPEAQQVYQEELRLRRGRDVEEVLMALGRVHYLAGEYGQALSLLGDLSRSDPLNVECLYYLGQTQAALGQYDDALTSLETASQLCIEYQSLHNRLEKGELSIVDQRQKGLTEEYLAQNYGSAMRFVSELYMWPSLNRVWGDTYYKAGRWTQARSAYRRCLDLEEGGNPSDPIPQSLIGQAFLGHARELFQEDGMLFQAISLVDAALENVEQALGNNERLALGHNIKGEIQLFQARTYVTMPELEITSHTFDDAIATFRKAIELDPEYVVPLHNLGIALTDIGSFAEAVTVLEKAVQMAPSDANIRASLAKAYLGQEQAQKALEEAQTALTLDPRNCEALLCAGLVDFYYRGRTADAINYFTKASELDKNRADAYLELGNAYYQMESWYRARREYLHALELIPEAFIANTSQERARINYLIAYTYHHAGSYEQEIHYLNTALSLQPAYIDALRQIARAYEASLQFRAAEVALRSALEASPDEVVDSQLHVQMGQMFERRGRPHDAVAAYTAALHADEANYEAQEGLWRLGASG
jgi:tetratricopeptide (TPR) repeat protein